jgi:hypothetical protein
VCLLVCKKIELHMRIDNVGENCSCYSPWLNQSRLPPADKLLSAHRFHEKDCEE